MNDLATTTNPIDVAASAMAAAALAMLPVHCACADLKPPYPASPVIQQVNFDFSSRDRRAPGSDNWPITWADDGNQYTSWGDGGGFGGTNSDGRVSLGVARIEGPADAYTGHNVWGGKDAENPAQFGGKSYGVIAVGNVLYMWVSPGSGHDNYREARLARSDDLGATWRRAGWAFTMDDGVMTPTFCQFGRGNSGARDDYVYVYATHLRDATEKMQVPGEIFLLRAQKEKLMQRSAWLYFAGTTDDGNAMWCAETREQAPVFFDPNGCRRTSVSYNAGLGRYILCTGHGEPDHGNLGMFDAPEPWGPWTTIGYFSNWGEFGSTFFWNFANKWLSTEGTRFTLVFTGTGHNDSWNTVRGRFEVAGEDTPADAAQ